MHIQNKLLWRKFVVGASSDLGQSFRPRQKRFGVGWGVGVGEKRLSRSDIRADEELPPSITVIAKLKNSGLIDLQFLLRELIPKY